MENSWQQPCQITLIKEGTLQQRADRKGFKFMMHPRQEQTRNAVRKQKEQRKFQWRTKSIIHAAVGQTKKEIKPLKCTFWNGLHLHSARSPPCCWCRAGTECHTPHTPWPRSPFLTTQEDGFKQSCWEDFSHAAGVYPKAHDSVKLSPMIITPCIVIIDTWRFN